MEFALFFFEHAFIHIRPLPRCLPYLKHPFWLLFFSGRRSTINVIENSLKVKLLKNNTVTISAVLGTHIIQGMTFLIDPSCPPWLCWLVFFLYIFFLTNGNGGVLIANFAFIDKGFLLSRMWFLFIVRLFRLFTEMFWGASKKILI